MAVKLAAPGDALKRGSPRQLAPRVRAVKNKKAPILTIALPGDYDVETKDVLVSLLKPAQTFDKAVIDLSKTQYLDCSSLTVLINLRKLMVELHGQADIRLAGANSNITKIMKITGLDEVFRMYATLEEAVAEGA